MSPADAAVEVTALSKAYGRCVALDGLSLAVPRGEVFGLLGPNGAGKTTTVKLLLGLARPTSGEVRLLGRRPGDRETMLRVGFLPEHFRFPAWLAARDLLDLHGRLCRMPAPRRRRRTAEVLERVGLAAWAAERVGSFSKGMTQRIGLAQALLSEPDLVFLDEPTSALDPLGRREVRDIIRDLRSAGVTVFLNSHLLGEVEATCDRVAIVKTGRVVRTGRLADLVGPALEVEIRADGLSTAVVDGLGRWGTVRRRDGDAGAVAARAAPDGVLADDGRPGTADGGLPGAGETLTLCVESEDVVPAVARYLVEQGAAVRAIAPRRTSLEEAFVRIVGEG